MGAWGMQTIVEDALRVADTAFWEDITYNGVVIRAMVTRIPQVNSQDNLSNFEYSIETDRITVPVSGAAVLITEGVTTVNCFSGQVTDRVTNLTWEIQCPRKG